MAWVVCQHSREAINAAGRDLITLDVHDPRRDDALEVINNWRSCHSYPLLIVKKTLQVRARRNVNRKALVAQRIKRLSSIALKLKHNPTMRLSQMQDIGGCRAVLSDVREVDRLVEVYNDAAIRHPSKSDRPFVFGQDNYILNPKPDGYRGIHLIIKYRSNHKPQYNSQNIEVQIRSKYQHAWATAVETCQTFTGQALKSKIKSASDQWLRFFALMSSAIAVRERAPMVPGTPITRRAISQEIAAIESQERIITLLEGWNAAMQRQDAAASHDANAFLLELNTEARMLRMTSFAERDMDVAHARYMEREKATEGDPAVQVVLVSADSVAALRRAYPNYYVDTSVFIQLVRQALGWLPASSVTKSG